MVKARPHLRTLEKRIVPSGDIFCLRFVLKLSRIELGPARVRMWPKLVLLSMEDFVEAKILFANKIRN